MSTDIQKNDVVVCVDDGVMKGNGMPCRLKKGQTYVVSDNEYPEGKFVYLTLKGLSDIWYRKDRFIKIHV